jgi:hypothetical protein
MLLITRLASSHRSAHCRAYRSANVGRSSPIAPQPARQVSIHHRLLREAVNHKPLATMTTLWVLPLASLGSASVPSGLIGRAPTNDISNGRIADQTSPKRT